MPTSYCDRSNGWAGNFKNLTHVAVLAISSFGETDEGGFSSIWCRRRCIWAIYASIISIMDYGALFFAHSSVTTWTRHLCLLSVSSDSTKVLCFLLNFHLSHFAVDQCSSSLASFKHLLRCRVIRLKIRNYWWQQSSLSPHCSIVTDFKICMMSIRRNEWWIYIFRIVIMEG